MNQVSAAKISYSSPDDKKSKRMLIRSVEYLTGRSKLEKRYNEILNANPPYKNVWEGMVEKLDLNLKYDSSKIQKIPNQKPLVIIANHPFGVVDGIVLGYLVSLIRDDFKFLVNSVLCKDPVLNEFFLPIDFNPSKQAQQTNILTRKIALEKIADGEPVVIFPSGGVATAPKFWKKAEDLEWKRFVVTLIKKAEATVVPIYFYGQNSRLFQVQKIR